MKKAFLREHGKSGIELVEEAFVLLRTCPPAILAAYLLGTVPFAAGFLLFCSDLAGRPGAEDRLGSATLAMTGLFLWMKFFHARFAAMLLARLRGETPTGGTPGTLLRSLSVQTIIHSTGFIILPLAAVAVLPLAWVYAFYQNISALDDGRTGLKDLMRSSWQQAALWPVQNHILLSVFSLFGFYVFINWITVALITPQLLNMFFGIESVFTHSLISMLNTTFFAAMAALTFLCVDPLLKTCYVLRCFYGKSLQTGDDLRTEIRRLPGLTAMLAAGLLFTIGSPTVSAQEPAPPPVVADGRLDQAITTVIQQDKYTWRTPPDTTPTKKDGLFAGFFKSLTKMIGNFFEDLGELIKKIRDWLSARDRQSPTQSPNLSWMTSQVGLLFVVLALAACGLALAAMRIVRLRRRSASVESSALATVPDLTNENTAADELPEDDWTRLGRQLLEQGDLRLALRAFYLASLAHLASRGLITIARSKSNRDYERELRRRGHAMPDLPVLFGENVGIFDRIWYGLHEVNAAVVQRFLTNLEKIKAAG